MEFIKIRIAEDFGHLGSDLEKTIEDMFRSMSPAFTLAERSWKPPMDMNETPEEIVIVAEVAGVEKDDLEVEISSKAVRIQGNRVARHCTDETTYRQEVRTTLLHELGHYLGLDEDDLDDRGLG